MKDEKNEMKEISPEDLLKEIKDNERKVQDEEIEGKGNK